MGVMKEDSHWFLFVAFVLFVVDHGSQRTMPRSELARKSASGCNSACSAN